MNISDPLCSVECRLEPYPVCVLGFCSPQIPARFLLAKLVRRLSW